MDEIPICNKCKVPLFIGSEFRWNDNGVITLGDTDRYRWVLLESNSIDTLFKSLEELIGLPVEPIVIESRRRETRQYMEKVFPPNVRLFLEQHEGQGHGDIEGITLGEEKDIVESARLITAVAYNMARIYGYGDLELAGPWESILEFPWRNTTVKNPYSLPMTMAECLGSIEAIDGRDQQVELEQKGENSYIVRCFEGEHPVHLSGKLKIKKYPLKPGDITYEYCQECGVPVEISSYIWELENGTIINPETNRRMALYGPYALDSVLNDLESELGEDIPNLAIEAMRRSVREAFSTENWLRRAPDFKHLISIRGLGNLLDFGGDKNHVYVKIENSCMHLSMIGIIQALVELAMKWDSSNCEYELTEDGTLSVTIKI